MTEGISLKKVYVDASVRDGLVTIVIENGERKRFYESIPRKLKSHEAEMLGIALALKKADGDVIIINDDKPIVELLNGIGKKRSSTITYCNEIKELSKNRKVEFKFESRWVNKGSLKHHGYSFYEIDNPKILEQSLALMKEAKEKEDRINKRVRKKKANK